MTAGELLIILYNSTYNYTFEYSTRWLYWDNLTLFLKKFIRLFDKTKYIFYFVSEVIVGPQQKLL